MINFHGLRVFYKVARLESVTRAAESLNISQPAVTKHVRNLEQELGVRLVEMSGRGVRITTAGQEVARIAKRLAAIEKDVLRYANDYRSGKAGELQLTATYLPANYMLPQRLADFKETHQTVKVQVATLNAQQALDKLIHGEVDMAFIGGQRVEAEGVHVHILEHDRVWFVVPANHDLVNSYANLREMLEWPFVLREEGSSMRRMLAALCRTHGYEPPQEAMVVSGSQETVRMIAAGHGVGFLSEMEVKDALERGELSRVHVQEAVGLHNTISLCVREGGVLLPAAEYFYKMMVGWPL